jgi:hypothetical protein
MNGVLFRRHNRPGLDALMQAWWDDTYRFALRDQFNLPGLIRSTDVPIHRWDWQFHFTDNPYFRSYFHRKPRGSAISTLARDVAKGIFLRASHSAPDRFASRLMNGIGIRTPYVPTRGMRDYLVEGPSVTGLAHGEHEADARN